MNSSLAPRSFTPYSRRLSASPGPHFKAPLVMNQDMYLQRSMEQMKADLAGGQERMAKLVESEHEQRMSGIAALQMQVDRLMTTVEDLSLAQDQMKNDLAKLRMQPVEESAKDESQSLREDLAKYMKQELQDSVRAAEVTLRAEAKRSIDDAIAQQLVKEHMQKLDVQVRELSESFKPMIGRIAKMTQECEVEPLPHKVEPTSCTSSASPGRSEEALEVKGNSEAEHVNEGNEATDSVGTGTTTFVSTEAGASQTLTTEESLETGKASTAGDANVTLMPIARRSSAPSFYPATVMPQPSPRSPNCATPTSLQLLPRQLQHAGSTLRHPGPPRRSASLVPAVMMWGGGSARLPRRNYTPESGSLHSVRAPPGTTVQEASQMNPRDQEATRLEAMRVAVATARPTSCSTLPGEGVRMLI